MQRCRSASFIVPENAVRFQSSEIVPHKISGEQKKMSHDINVYIYFYYNNYYQCYGGGSGRCKVFVLLWGAYGS